MKPTVIRSYCSMPTSAIATPRAAARVAREKQSLSLKGIFIVGTLVVLFLFYGCIVKAFAMEEGSVVEAGVAMERVLVQPGDTLWGIASQYKPIDVDVRKFVHEISKLNHMENKILQVGDVVLIPIR